MLQPKRLIAKAERVVELKEQIKALYVEMDVLIMEIASKMLHERETSCESDGRVLTLIDNFTDEHDQPRNVAFKTVASRRFEIKLEDQ